MKLEVPNFEIDFCSRQVDRIQAEPRITFFYEKKSQKVVEKIEMLTNQKLDSQQSEDNYSKRL